MPTHRLLEGTDIAKLLQQVRDEHGEDAKIVRAERVRTGGLGGFFSREHFELAIEIDPDDHVADSVADVMRPATPELSAEPPARATMNSAPKGDADEAASESAPDLFGAVMNSEFRRSVTAKKAPTLIPDDATELSSPVDALVSSSPSLEDTFTSSVSPTETTTEATRSDVNQRPAAAGRRTVREFTPTKLSTTDNSSSTSVGSVDVAVAEQSTPMITPDVAQQILAAAAAAVAAAEATTRSIDSPLPLPTDTPNAVTNKRTVTAHVPKLEATSIAASATSVETIEESPELQEISVGRHSKGNPIVAATQAHMGSDRESLQRPFLGLATSSTVDSLRAASSGALDSVMGLTSDGTTLGTWLALEDGANVDHLPWPPRRPGEVLVLVGDAVAALHAARDIARHTRLGSGSVFVVAPDLLPELSEERRIANPAHARQRRAELSQAASASIIVIDAPLTMAGDPLAAEWVREMMHALSATAVWAVVDATRRPKDVRRWLTAIGGADGIVAHDVAATSEPGELLQLGAPVAYLDGVHATAGAWHAAHAHAMSLDRAASAQSVTYGRDLSERASS